MRNQLRQLLTDILMSTPGGEKTEEVMAGWQTVFISWLPVTRQWVRAVCGSTSNPYIARVILTITARLTAARLLYWMYIIMQPRQETRQKNRTHRRTTHMHFQTIHTHPQRDLLDWQWFVRFSCIYLCTPSECTSQFSSKLKALICHPVQSKFNASNYRGSASRQIWSEEAWQESLLRIRAF